MGFPESIYALGPPTHDGADPTAEAAGLISAALASGKIGGYVFTYSFRKDSSGRTINYTIHADPGTPDLTDGTHYFTDQGGVIRQDAEKPANAESAPITGSTP